MLPEAVFATLMALSEGDMDTFEIEAASGFSRNYLGVFSQGMKSRGWIGYHYSRGPNNKYGDRKAGKWWITERGKIVLAIECGRRTKSRAKGIRPGYKGATPVRDYRYGDAA